MLAFDLLKHVVDFEGHVGVWTHGSHGAGSPSTGRFVSSRAHGWGGYLASDCLPSKSLQSMLLLSSFEFWARPGSPLAGGEF
jgi:hypothetical protein